MHKNILTVVGITILFLGLAIQPSIADNVNTDNKSSEEYKEIITYIIGMGFDVNLNWINKRGNYRGEAIITLFGDHGGLKVYGFGWSNGKIVFFKENASYIQAYRFIGYYDMGDFGWPYIRGITFGNIVWYHEQ
jgi:hypothetical protein